MRIENLSKEIREVLDNAKFHAERLGHTYIGTEHIILVFLHNYGNMFGIDFRTYENKVICMIGKGDKTSLSLKSLTSATKRCLEPNDDTLTLSKLLSNILTIAGNSAITIFEDIDPNF